MQKKGISPLIATVLVIGFTIILAALVFQWGGEMFKDVQEETGAASEAKITCTSGLTNLDVSTETNAAGNLAVVLDNKNNVDLAGFMARAYLEDGSVVRGEWDDTLGAYDIQSFELEGDLSIADPGVSEIGVFPMIALDNGDVITCESEIKVSV